MKWSLGLVFIGVLAACSDTPAPPTKSTAASSANTAPSASAAPTSMPLATFCKQFNGKIAELTDTCVAKPGNEEHIKILQLGKDHDAESCDEMQNVEIVADKVPACLAEIRSWWDAGLPEMQQRPACRAAFIGRTPASGMCSIDFECPAGSFCDVAEKGTACAPVLTLGAACLHDEQCGAEAYCPAGKCVAAIAAGQPCKVTRQHCVRPLTCLRDNATTEDGKCGPRRKAGEVCHRWTECEGVCVMASKTAREGKCESFCGSP